MGWKKLFQKRSIGRFEEYFEMILFLVSWLIIGFWSSCLAISIFRSGDGEISRKDLYLATIGPFFGPIVFAMIVIDFIRVFLCKKR